MENRAPDQDQMDEIMPERWETAVEDIAQVVALALDRAQDLADVINDVVRAHPVASKAVVATAFGAVVGGIVAGRTIKRRPTFATVAERTTREAAKSVSSRWHAATAAGRNGQPSLHAVPPLPDASQMRYAAQLFPIALSLLKNPLVRDFLVRKAMGAARRTSK